MKIFVALWSKDTEHQIPGDMDERCAALVEAIKGAETALAAWEATNPGVLAGEIRSIFLAPEYLFTREADKGRAEKGRAITSDQALALRSRFAALSKERPGMLFIPGSVIYSHKASEQAKGGEADGAAAVIASLKASKAEAEAAANARGFIPEQKVAIKGLATGTKPELAIDQKLARLEGTITGDTLIVKNKVQVFLNGKVVAVYGKKADMNEVAGQDADAGVFLPGRSSGLAEFAGIKFGFEICFDHPTGVLKAFNPNARVDLHVICSAWAENTASTVMCKPGGFVLHASSRADLTDVFHKGRMGFPVGGTELDANANRNDTQKAMYEKMKRVNCDYPEMKCFVIDLEPAVVVAPVVAKP